MPWIDGKEVTHEEYNAWDLQQWQERRRAFAAEYQAKEAERREGERLVRKLGSAYTEYQKFLETRPHLRPQATGRLSEEQAFYEQLRRNLGHADDAPRCTHIKADGLRCRSPRMKTHALCYAHQRMAQATSVSLRLNYEDPNSIQLGLMEVSRALVEHEISGKDAGRLLFALQIAAGNVDRVTFHQTPAQMVLEAPAEETRQPAPPTIPNERIDDLIDEDPKLLAIGNEMDHQDSERFADESSPPVEAVPEPEPVHPAAIAPDVLHNDVLHDPAHHDPAYQVECEPAYHAGP